MPTALKLTYALSAASSCRCRSRSRFNRHSTPTGSNVAVRNHQLGYTLKLLNLLSEATHSRTRSSIPDSLLTDLSLETSILIIRILFCFKEDNLIVLVGDLFVKSHLVPSHRLIARIDRSIGAWP